MALYHVYLLILFARDSLSNEQKASLTASLKYRLADRTKPLDLLGIWSMHRIGSLLGITFDLSAYNDTFTSRNLAARSYADNAFFKSVGS